MLGIAQRYILLATFVGSRLDLAEKPVARGVESET
jgi:hypothetical protein